MKYKQGARKWCNNSGETEEVRDSITFYVKCLFQGNKLKAFAANAAKDPMLKIRSSDNGRDQDQAGQLSEISLSILIWKNCAITFICSAWVCGLQVCDLFSNIRSFRVKDAMKCENRNSSVKKTIH